MHGGHGYLIDQFLRPESIPRTDGYGGDLDGRTRSPPRWWRRPRPTSSTCSWHR
ncbi:hypothetical protein ACFZBF_23600 [Streptomyces pseudovenezuelae]|uniref:oxidoreductase n=1 Tax=Streptomyces pseudovenezuelae TaxID=67350 RepID=UPI0036EF152D